jgi:hypothetical protein
MIGACRNLPASAIQNWPNQVELKDATTVKGVALAMMNPDAPCLI